MAALCKVYLRKFSHSILRDEHLPETFHAESDYHSIYFPKFSQYLKLLNNRVRSISLPINPYAQDHSMDIQQAHTVDSP